MDLSEEQILTLAPDESSKKSGKDLANPAKWVSKGISTRALWGECQGSGSKPYQTQIDLTNLAFKCSCPSRKFPCKHGLGLLLLSARQPALFQQTEEPAWVSEWLNKRIEKEEKKIEKKEAAAPVDEAAQAKRQQARQQKVADGITELLLWIKDQVRSGIHIAPAKTPAWWENMARRMVDAQAPGLAGMIRTLGNTNFFREGWQSEYIDQLLRIYLVSEGYQRLDQLDPGLKDDINSHIGFTINQEELKETEGSLDTWLVLGKQITEDEGLTTERYWLFGTTTRKYALILQFLVRGQGAQLSLTPGLFIRAELVFFPSAAPLRALIKRQVQADAAGEGEGFADWQQLTAATAATAGILPFANERPFVVQRLIPIRHGGQWWLKDDRQTMMPVKENFRKIWRVLALSGGQPLNMALIGREKTFEPIGVWHDHQYKMI
ncbi:MAG: SWIM zinc finger family protein [Chitinophagaceae bacterium]|nr:SWIM zinc finger family protein [Chitinophagaceae bacterium]